MSTVSGGPRPDDFNDDDVLTADLFKQATGFWVTDDVPSDGEGKDGDVVFVLKDPDGGVYAKNNGTWVHVGPASIVSAEGAPGAPTILNPEGGSVIKFTPAPEGAAGPNLAHGASISPNDNGEFVTVDQDNLEVAVLGTTPFTDYVVSVYGVNEAGRGEVAKTDVFQINYNDATGGDEAIVDDYNNTGEKWKVHTFTDDGTLSVDFAPNKFKMLVVGAGTPGAKGSGDGTSWQQGGAGGRGGFLVEQEADLSATDHVVTLGKVNGETTIFGNIDANNDGVSGDPGAGGRCGGNASANGVAAPAGGVTSNITGEEKPYGGGGGGGAANSNNNTWRSGGAPASAGAHGAGIGPNCCTTQAPGPGGSAQPNTGGGGGGGPVYYQNCCGNPNHKPAGGVAGSGVVIVAYKIGMSTTREISQAKAEVAAREAEKAARQAGVEEGLEQGLQQGYIKAQEDLYTAVEEVKSTVDDAADAIIDEVVVMVSAEAAKAMSVEDFDTETDVVEEETSKNPNKGSGNNSGKGGRK